MLVDHDLTSSLQAWIEADSVPDKQIQMIDYVYWESALHVSFKGWYFHLFCYPVLLLAFLSEYVLQIISYSQPTLLPSPNLLCHLLYFILKLTRIFALCAKWPLWKNQKHWQNTQLDLNSDTGMSFQPFSVRKSHLFLDWNIFRCCNYFKLFYTERAYGKLSYLAWFYLAGKLHNFSKHKYWFAVLGWFVDLFGFGFLWVYQKKNNVSHNRKHFFPPHLWHIIFRILFIIFSWYFQQIPVL